MEKHLLNFQVQKLSALSKGMYYGETHPVDPGATDLVSSLYTACAFAVTSLNEYHGEH